MKQFSRVFLLLAILSTPALSGCGFSPIYGQSSASRASVEGHLAKVFVASIPDREGQYLYNALIDRFYRGGYPSEAPYLLEVGDLKEAVRDLDITVRSDATRGQLRMSATFMLRDRLEDVVVLKRELSAITSYNILSSEFTNRVSEDNARLNALDDLARQIELQIGLYFDRQN